MEIISRDLGYGPETLLRYELPANYRRTGSTLVPTAAKTLHPPGSAYASAISGVRVPWLNDALSDPIYAGDPRTVALEKFLSSWQRQVSTLWRSQSSAFSLRLIWKPDQGSVELAALTRSTGLESSVIQEATVASKALRSVLMANRWPVTPMAAEDLTSICSPDWATAGVEIRQAESLFTLHMLRQQVEAYAVLPFAQPRGDWWELLTALTAQTEPVLINLHLQPTQMMDEEKTSISAAATLAKRLIDFRFEGRADSYNYQNPQAETVFRIYNTLENRLQNPFLIVAQVFAPTQHVADLVGDILGAGVVGKASREIEQQIDEVPSGFETTRVGRENWNASRAVLSHMWFAPCGPSHATPGKERLRYLVDARGAASLFRFPVPRETGLPGVEVRKPQLGQESSQRNSKAPQNHLLLGKQADGHILSLPVRDLTRHGLICGLPGSGKTNTSLSLLAQIWKDYRIPFWVFEPPKTEYRGLLKQPGFEDLLIFTVGDESAAPLRLNPFELLPEISVEQHVASLRLCFEAGLPKIDESGQLLGMFLDGAIRDAYRANRWRFGDTSEAGREFPTLHSLLPHVTKALQAYAGENRQNLEAAIGNRIRSLLRGSKGRMFNVERGIPVEELMHRPVIFELQPMGPDAPLALMFLLNLLQEYASQRQITHPLGVEHVTLIEEAHVVMARADGHQSGASAGVSHAFERILAELRSSGEGVLIAEQSPTKLIKGAIDLTNLKIVHRLSGPEEVAAVGGAMIATEGQKGAFQRLDVGEAAIFMQGLQGLTFFRAPNFKGEAKYVERLPTAEVRKAMAPYYTKHPRLKLPFQGCSFCESVCRYRDDVDDALTGRVRQAIAVAAINRSKVWAEKAVDVTACEQADQAFYGALAAAGAAAGHGRAADAAWCSWVHSADEEFIFVRDQRKGFEAGFARLGSVASAS